MSQPSQHLLRFFNLTRPQTIVSSRMPASANRFGPARKPGSRAIATDSGRCEKCQGNIRHLFECCGQRFCVDYYLDHASESRSGVQRDPTKDVTQLTPLERALAAPDTYEPPLSEETLSFLATSGPETARLRKLLAPDQYGKGDPSSAEGVANVDEIEFTICRNCDRSPPRFFVSEGKALCTDCWLDHCAES